MNDKPRFQFPPSHRFVRRWLRPASVVAYSLFLFIPISAMIPGFSESQLGKIIHAIELYTLAAYPSFLLLAILAAALNTTFGVATGRRLRFDLLRYLARLGGFVFLSALFVVASLCIWAAHGAPLH